MPDENTHRNPTGVSRNEAARQELPAGGKGCWVDSVADFCEGVEHSVLLRVGYEIKRFDVIATDSCYDHTPGFKRIVDRIRARGVSNVAFGATMAFGGTRGETNRWQPHVSTTSKV